MIIFMYSINSIIFTNCLKLFFAIFSIKQVNEVLSKRFQNAKYKFCTRLSIFSCHPSQNSQFSKLYTHSISFSTTVTPKLSQPKLILLKAVKDILRLDVEYQTWLQNVILPFLFSILVMIQNHRKLHL